MPRRLLLYRDNFIKVELPKRVMTQKDAIVVHSGFLTTAGTLDSESQNRVEKGLELLAQGIAPFIIMNGGPGCIRDADGNVLGHLDRRSNPLQAPVMAAYALAKGVPADKILLQDYSSDTVGEVLFNLGMNLAPRGLTNIVAVSTTYHGPRIRTIANQIYGDSYHVNFVGSEDRRNDTPETKRAERQLTDLFLRQFADIARGDAKGFETALYQRHPIYNKIPEQERRHFTYALGR